MNSEATNVMDDPFTMELPLCDEDGIVRRGAMHHGTDYICTGHAHFEGEHINCSTPFHRSTHSYLVDGKIVMVPFMRLATAEDLKTNHG